MDADMQTYPHSATVTGAHFVEPILAQQIEEGAISLEQAVLVLVHRHVPQHPLVHQRCSLDATAEPVLDLHLAHQDGLNTALQRSQDGGHLDGRGAGHGMTACMSPSYVLS